ncbi:MAG: alkaline phosphatase [Bdellovibrionales bacterium]|nr:alkaline phosphatase [Bdellovibrionales bacterium]
MKLGQLLFNILIAVTLGCALPSNPADSTSAKNVILLIGDGMGPQQIALAVAYSKHISKSELNLYRLMRDGEVGAVMAEAGTNLVIDSACSATQMASGRSCRPEMLGLDVDGNKVQTIVERAKLAGKSTGLVSDTRLTHATPAAFASHVIHRQFENEIAQQLIESGTDVMLSGGLRHFIPSNILDSAAATSAGIALSPASFPKVKSARRDEEDLLAAAMVKGYETVFDIAGLKASKANKLLGLFALSGMPDAIEMRSIQGNPARSMPTLAEMTTKALEVLARNPKGFFLMVEGGQIDWAGHENDAGRMLHEMLRFDEAVGAALTWAKNRSDTLIVATADHETGSFGFSYSAKDIPEAEQLSQGFFKSVRYEPRYNFGRRENLRKLFDQKRSFTSIVGEFESLNSPDQSPERLAAMVGEATPFILSVDQAREVLAKEPNRFYIHGHSELGNREAPIIRDFTAFYPYIENNRINLIARALADQQDVVWGTGTHTSVPVLVIAHGPSKLTDRFDGFLDMTELGRLLFESMGFDAAG